MAYKVISPLGPRVGPGTFDAVWEQTNYPTIEEAMKASDYAVINFVEDEDRIKYFEAYYIRTPEVKKYLRLEIQDFPFGIDMIDDQNGFRLGVDMLP